MVRYRTFQLRPIRYRAGARAILSAVFDHEEVSVNETNPWVHERALVTFIWIVSGRDRTRIELLVDPLHSQDTEIDGVQLRQSAETRRRCVRFRRGQMRLHT